MRDPHAPAQGKKRAYLPMLGVCGRVRDIDPDGLVHVFVFAEGIRVNGSELVKGLRRGLPGHMAVTGSLAGDGDRFGRTTVGLNDRTGEQGVAAIGFYGDRLHVGYGSLGGWDPLGPERLITRSEGNVLFELDGNSALDLYRTYLGPYADDLPASGLLFPLALRGSSCRSRPAGTSWRQRCAKRS